MALISDKNMQIRSANGRFSIEAKEELLLECGGSYVRVSSTGIEDGTKGNRTIKSTAFGRQKFSIIRDDGSVIQGRTDASGKTGLQHGLAAESVRLRIEDESA
ncbi:DUF2345 domain-containing protein [Paraburkholderia sp. CNPSo 3281]|uniref:DUF2345 domain-containing protein n=1 Tax=Paraburkholderia sp. CNPSo 3281 TaxID=2940933 RepID=UPI0020B89E7F|nr:DUF2345 domain-containing protein [Paraburkholderia sp. CNPSo 3281]MCP3721037.1 DUF2345 domain-containing protein [Paraburkholderia sp. CNPSo 3281]